VDLHVCCNEEEIREALTLLYDIHRRRWQRRGQEGSFARRARLVEFNNRFAPLSLSRGWLRLYTLSVAGQPVACLLAHVYNGIAHGLQIAFDPDVDGAGRVLMGEVLRMLIAEGVVEYDFLGGQQKYKRDLGGEFRQAYQTFAARRCLRGRLVSGPGLWPTGRFITQGPPESFGCSHD
jgi:CelD/BcsL family acetyltransferase involved in cellulose biosynthesis